MTKNVLVSRSLQIAIGFVFSLVALIVAVVVSYTILQNIIASQRALGQTDLLINNIQLSITDSVGIWSDHRTEARSAEPNDRILQLNAKRAEASIKELSQSLDRLLAMQPALQSTDVWNDVGWIVDSSEGSANHLLRQYLDQMNSAIGELSTGTESKPQVPIEAAGARYGTMVQGYQQALKLLGQIQDEKSYRLENVHRLMTTAVIIILILVSTLLIAPLWIKLVEEHKALEVAHDELSRIAYTDRETGLPNLAGLESNLAMYRCVGTCHLMLVRIRNLDELYGLIGSEQVDILVKSVSQRLQNWDIKNQSWCRSGEAEFCCILSDAEYRNSDDWIQAFHHHVTSEISVAGVVVRLDASIATSLIGDTDSLQQASLWQHQSNARLALLGFNTSNCWLPAYDSARKQKLIEQNNLINQIGDGLKNNQFLPHYQLKVDAKSGGVSSVEVLARWILPDGTIVPPGVFIPVAESSGLIVDLTFQLFDKVAADTQQWCANGYRVGRVAINIAADVLHHPELLMRLDSLKRSLPIQCEGIEVEITENIVLGDSVDTTNGILREIQKMGIHVAIDDFGTGYASLQTLIDLPIDVLKIDRAFVLPMTECGKGSEVVSAMISLSNKLSKRCVVEGVETKWQWLRLAELGADELQGFYFHKPAGNAAIEVALHNQADWGMTA